MVYFIPTPIGNLKDITYRTIEILQSCEILICEDTRVSKKLLHLITQKLNIDFNNLQNIKFVCLNSHNFDSFIKNFDINDFSNKICAYLSDAGMPGISDPACDLINFLQSNNIDYEVLPGANAALLSAVGSGIVQKEFLFYGFLPISKESKKIELQNLLNQNYPFILYESPKRIKELINLINDFDEDREIFIIKEATKKFEISKRLIAKDMAGFIDEINTNGEFSVVVAGSDIIKKDFISVDDILNLNITPKEKAKLISKITGDSIKSIYEKLIKS